MDNVKEGFIEGRDQTNGGLFEVIEGVRDELMIVCGVDVVDVMAEFRIQVQDECD